MIIRDSTSIWPRNAHRHDYRRQKIIFGMIIPDGTYILYKHFHSPVYWIRYFYVLQKFPIAFLLFALTASWSFSRDLRWGIELKKQRSVGLNDPLPIMQVRRRRHQFSFRQSGRGAAACASFASMVRTHWMKMRQTKMD